MKKTVILLLLIFSAVTLFSEEQYDFRKVRWGMSFEEVLKSENKVPLISEKDYCISYVDVYFEEKVTINYFFLGGKLYSVIIFFYSNFTADKNRYFEEYKRIKRLLVDNYGEPSISQRVSNGKILKDNEITNDSIVGKKYEIYDKWIFKKTTTEIFISNQDPNYYINVTYNERIN